MALKSRVRSPNSLRLRPSLSAIVLRWDGIEVPDSAHGFDPLGAIRQGPEFPPQMADVKIDAALERGEWPAERNAGQLFPVHNSSCITHEHLKEIELGRCKC